MGISTHNHIRKETEQQKMQQTEADNNAIRLAEYLDGSVVTIWGKGGALCFEDANCSHNQVMKTKRSSHSQISQRFKFIVERVPPGSGVPLGAVAFRVIPGNANIGHERVPATIESTSHSTQSKSNGIAERSNDDNNVDEDGTYYYLTNVMYGDRLRQNAANGLASIPHLPTELIPDVVDYVAGTATDKKNFEGAGFNYSPMVMQRGREGIPPHKMQQFVLVDATTNRYTDQPVRLSTCQRVGVKSVFGTFWRSQWWDNVISQSSHLLEDETWRFYTCHRKDGPPHE